MLARLNDDACGLCSEVTYIGTGPIEECTSMTLQQGCVGEGSCTGHTKITYGQRPENSSIVPHVLNSKKTKQQVMLRKGTTVGVAGITGVAHKGRQLF